MRLNLILVLLLATPAQTSDFNWPTTPRKPWTDPIPAPESPRDPTEPVPEDPQPGFPEPLPFRPGFDRLLSLIEDLRMEIANLKNRLRRLESFHNRSRSAVENESKTCQLILPTIKKASAEYFINGGTALQFDGQKRPFLTLQTSGYLAVIPKDWRSIRGALPGNISCIP